MKTNKTNKTNQDKKRQPEKDGLVICVSDITLIGSMGKGDSISINIEEPFEHAERLKHDDLTATPTSILYKKNNNNGGGTFVNLKRILSIDRVDDADKITIIVDSPIGKIDSLATNMSMGKNEIVYEIGKHLVVKRVKKAGESTLIGAYHVTGQTIMSFSL